MFRQPQDRRSRIQFALVVAFLAAFYLAVRYAANWIDGGHDLLELQDAIVRGNIDEIERQLGAIASPNVRNPNDGRTALHVAIDNGNREVVELLFEYGANPNLKDHFGHTPLFNAVWNGLDMTKLLLEHGAKTDVQDDIGATPLHNAVFGGDLDIVKVLVSHGAPLHGISELDFGPFGTPAVVALRAGRVDREQRHSIARYILFEAGNGDFSEENLDTLLHAAAFAGDVELIKSFAEAGADPTAQYVHLFQSIHGDRYTSLLENAVLSDSVDAVRAVIELGANVLQPISSGEPHLLQQTYNTAILQLLIDSGLDVKFADNYGLTALHGAARLNAVDAARLLIEAGADVNARTRFGDTPVYIAAESSSVQVLTL